MAIDLTMHHLRRFRRKDALLIDGLPPSLVPSGVVPSVTAKASTIIPSVGDASTSASLGNASQDVKRYLINASQDIEKTLACASPSWFRDMAPVRITCHDWNEGGIFDWYRRQPYTIIRKLELRKERDHFKHEFIVIYLDNGWYHRIERRPMKGASTETVSREGCEAEDSLTPISDKDLEVIHSEADAEITLEFHSNKPDLYNVIAIAVAIHLDPQTRNYTLQQYNCYFVARSIIALVTRHCLLRVPPMTYMRWDRVTEPAIFSHIFGGNWNKLAAAMKMSVSVALEILLWGVIKSDVGTRLEKKKDWNRLRDVVKSVIREEVERSSTTLVTDQVKKAVNKWIMDATQATLWHENLDQSLSELRYAERYAMTAAQVLKVALKPDLEINLPRNMLKALSEILPERLINRIPRVTLENMPPELMGRTPARVLEKIPDDFIAKLPYDSYRRAPAELWQNLSVRVFAKTRNAMVLTLPDDLSTVPQRFLEVSLQRMQDVLDQPTDHPDRVLALQLLRRLPQEQLAQLDPSYIPMRYSEVDEELDRSGDPENRGEQKSDEPVQIKPRHLIIRRIKGKWDEASFIGFLIRLAPMPVLKCVPPRIMDLMPDSSLELIPTSVLERIPSEFLAKISNHSFEKLPTGLLRKINEPLLQKLPRPTLERLPTTFLERLPPELLAQLPPELLNNIPEDLTDQILEVIQSSAFEGEELKQELLEKVKEVSREALVTTSGELPATVRVSVRANSTKRADEQLLKHEDLQEHILRMNRAHSKMVAQVPLLGMSEERVYGGLRTKTEEIWQVMRLHPSLPDHY
ncbi:hypothetical protein APHAL10511_005502 [Amanita phalloides]|nr:hypothetical protein APHAL10511_005502 [Amanita phalloides]